MSELITTDLPPCPFCGSTDLTKNLWQLDKGEVDAIECNQCYAGAPLTSWDKRDDSNRRIQRTDTDRAA